MDAALESEVTLMCNLSKGVREEGIQQGIQQGREETLMEAIANLMRSMKLNFIRLGMKKVF